MMVMLMGVVTNAQNTPYVFSFTAIDSNAYVALDSIRIMNRTQGGTTVLYWPDTTISLEISEGDLLLFIGYATEFGVGIGENQYFKDGFRISSLLPNPVSSQSRIMAELPVNGTLRLTVSDLRGRVLEDSHWDLGKGIHSFNVTPGSDGLFILTARLNDEFRSIKLMAAGNFSGRDWSLEYAGRNNSGLALKKVAISKGIVRQSGILDRPDSNSLYTFQFATNIPCPGTPTVTYEGQIYNTIQIFSQCWIKENMNVGSMIPGTQEMTDNSIVEKYCHSNSPDSCEKYGALYQWNEMMQYDTAEGIQGICPPGWHLGTDEEWKVLAGATDDVFGIGDTEWDYSNMRGTSAGKNLKALQGWKYSVIGNGTDAFGFSALPASYRLLNGGFDLTCIEGVWWTSTLIDSDKAWYINMHYFSPQLGRWDDQYSVKPYGFSARCLQD